MLRIQKLTTMIILAASLVVFTDWPIHTGGILVAATDGCDCDSPGCDGKTCASRRRFVRHCPKCQHDVCTLKCEKVVVKKKCFDVDQKIVCIPRITWPWQKCCNRCAKTRTVNVLGVKKYECRECQYKWTVYEPPVPKTIKQLEKEEQQRLKAQEKLEAAQPQYEQDQLYDPAGSDIPEPPVQNGG